MHEDYQTWPWTQPLERCPCCGSQATMWGHSTSSDDVVRRVVLCDNQEAVGPRDALAFCGCLLAEPPQDFYKPTGREAAQYWNEYARALKIKRN
jgi:hypothetical protein